MAIDYGQIKNSPIYNASQEAVATTRQAGKVQDGESILFTKNNESILSIDKRGDGAIVAMTDSALFANSSLGYTKNVANEQQLKLYELEFWMLGQLIQMPGGRRQDENSKARE